jgi:hypothetical protein
VNEEAMTHWGLLCQKKEERSYALVKLGYVIV